MADLQTRDYTPEQADEINERSTDDAFVVDVHHVNLAAIERTAQDSVRRPRLLREAPVRADDPAAANRRMNEHLAVVAHELRNSLGAIRMAARLMEMNQRKPPLLGKARLVIEHQAGQMARL